ncbi:MAG: hypothetical protein JXI43_07500 [Tissierellales bacterium]|nr:hypothetical protein [Tissierellales bacterium]
MTSFEILSILTAIVVVIISSIALYFNGKQTKRAAETIELQQQLAKANVIEHFTGRFFDLLRDGKLHVKIVDPDWAYQFWSLLSTEFYFFHHGILPKLMYTLWMMDLASIYCDEENGENVRKSHVKYLDTYSIQYSKMTDFFEEICNIAKQSSNEKARNDRIQAYVFSWISKNERPILS